MFRSLPVMTLLLAAFSAGAEESLDVLSRSYADIDYTASSNSDQLMRGQFRPVNFTVLSAGMDGKLEKFSVRPGSTVKKGELIASFACQTEQSNFEIALAREKAAEKSLDVNQRLNEYQNVSELELTMSESEVEIASAEVRRARAILGQCEIQAPFNATVTEKFVQAFQYVGQGDQLLEIVDTENLEIEMVLPSVTVQQYAQGRQFTITVDETSETLQAEIDRVVNVIDPVSQTIRVIGKLLEPHAGLMPGMSGVIHLAASMPEGSS